MQNMFGKKALITGAASGIGRAVSLKLAAEGAYLFLLDINESGLEDVAEEASHSGVEVICQQCDLSNPQQISDSVKALIDTWGHVDILINNAGVAYYGPTHAMTAEQWDWILTINLLAPIQLTRELLPTLIDRPVAHIVNVSSIFGLVPAPQFTAYQASKFGLVGFSEALRAEYDRQGVGVSVICPSHVTTPLFEKTPCGIEGETTPIPPRWICSTPETVAKKIIKAIKRDKRLSLVGWVAYAFFSLRLIAPWILDIVYQFGRRKEIKRKTALHQASAELQIKQSTEASSDL